MGLVTLYIAIGFFFAWRFFATLDALEPKEIEEISKKVTIAPEIMGEMRPLVAILFTLIWPYFAVQDVWSFMEYVASVPTKVRTWFYVRRFQRWYTQLTDHLVFLEVEPEEFFAFVSYQELVEMFASGLLPLYPVKCYVRLLRGAAMEFAREAESAKEAA